MKRFILPEIHLNILQKQKWKLFFSKKPCDQVPHARFLKEQVQGYETIDIWGDSLLNTSTHGSLESHSWQHCKGDCINSHWGRGQYHCSGTLCAYIIPSLGQLPFPLHFNLQKYTLYFLSLPEILSLNPSKFSTNSYIFPTRILAVYF